jgi:translocator protein
MQFDMTTQTKSFLLYFLLFLTLHFGALYVGASLMGSPNSEWYQNLKRAPWSPPGFVFGLAWTTIMICVSLALAYTFPKVGKFKNYFILIIAFELIFNVLWNPLFFKMHLVGTALIDMFFLALFVFLLFRTVWIVNKKWAILVAPYVLWICVATSLNVYIWLYN